MCDAQLLEQLQSLPPSRLWPPPAAKDGMACTLEVSYLALALPGSPTLCIVARLQNNVQSPLSSWQLVGEFRSAPDLGLTSATGAELLSQGNGGFHAAKP
jgi:hypothetical protein